MLPFDRTQGRLRPPAPPGCDPVPEGLAAALPQRSQEVSRMADKRCGPTRPCLVESGVGEKWGLSESAPRAHASARHRRAGSVIGERKELT